MTGCGGSPPRDAELYDWSDHFRDDSLPDSVRFLSDEMVKETLEEGRDCDRVEAGRGKLRRKKTYSGVDAVLVLPEDDTYIITGWTEINDMGEAALSDRWEIGQLEKIQAFEEQHNPDYKPIGES
jgi:hypothetical protein